MHSKKKFKRYVRRLQKRNSHKHIEVWTQDEARLGLKPIIRRVWSRKGERPIASHRTRYQWLYVYCFVEPLTGKTSWLLLPTVNAELMTMALRTFAKEQDSDNRKILIVILDGAGYHDTEKVDVPANVRLYFLPSHTPELNPTESVWPLVRESAANRTFADLDELERVLVRRCRWLIKNPETVRGRAGFRWIAVLTKRKESG